MRLSHVVCQHVGTLAFQGCCAMPTMQSCSTLPQQQLLQQDGEVTVCDGGHARAALQLKSQSHSLIVDHIVIIMIHKQAELPHAQSPNQNRCALCLQSLQGEWLPWRERSKTRQLLLMACNGHQANFMRTVGSACNHSPHLLNAAPFDLGLDGLMPTVQH